MYSKPSLSKKNEHSKKDQQFKFNELDNYLKKKQKEDKNQNELQLLKLWRERFGHHDNNFVMIAVPPPVFQSHDE